MRSGELRQLLGISASLSQELQSMSPRGLKHRALPGQVSEIARFTPTVKAAWAILLCRFVAVN
eukprot:13925884-Alexandrium_andersonii.AAC.1